MARASGGRGGPVQIAVAPVLMLEDLGQVTASLWALGQGEAGLQQEGHLAEKELRESPREIPRGLTAEGARPDSCRREARKPVRQHRGRQRSQGAAEKQAWALLASPPTRPADSC